MTKVDSYGVNTKTIDSQIALDDGHDKATWYGD